MITKAFEIDQKAKGILKSLFPNNWLIREHIPDFHVDYLIETPIENEPSGKNFAVQLKGREKINVNKGIISYQIATKHLRYYIRFEIPIYLILVNVEKKIGYWLFFQKYIKESINESVLNKQKTITLKIPVKNEIRKIEEFLNEINQAHKYIKDLFPSSPGPAIAKQLSDWNKLDPRFKVVINADQDTIAYNLTAKESIRLNFLVYEPHADKFRNLLRDSIDKGEKFSFDRNDIQVSGSNLIEELWNLYKPGDVNFKLYPEVKSSLFIYPFDYPEKSISNINGKLAIGRKQFRFSGTMDDGLINVVVVIIPNFEENSIHTNLTIDIYFNKWTGKSIHLLPHYNQIFEFFNKLNNNCDMGYNIQIVGNKYIGNKDFKIKNGGFPKEAIVIFLNYIKKIKYISEKSGIDIYFTKIEDFDIHLYGIIDPIYDILTIGKFQKKFLGYEISIKKDSFGKKLPIENILNSALTFKSHNWIVRILDKDINLGETEFTISNCVVEFDKKTEFFRIMGSENSELLIRKI